ncbi:MAG: recombination mediator RecR [Candidatus Omnitrophota bacterium]
MDNYTGSMSTLIHALKKMPGLGPKSAQRIAFYILRLPIKEAKALAFSILKVKEKIRFCSRCGNLSEETLCNICKRPGRDETIICVVEQPNDILALEKASVFKGLYHVLGGALSPLDGIEPQNLRIAELIERLKKEKIKEIIIATDSDSEGETTALYLAGLLKKEQVKVSRIAFGLPAGSNLEYADELTLSSAIEGRRKL